MDVHYSSHEEHILADKPGDCHCSSVIQICLFYPVAVIGLNFHIIRCSLLVNMLLWTSDTPFPLE